MGLEGRHVQIGDEIDHPDCPCHKRDLVLLISQEFYHLEGA